MLRGKRTSFTATMAFTTAWVKNNRTAQIHIHDRVEVFGLQPKEIASLN
jgi:hypothetical protein